MLIRLASGLACLGLVGGFAAGCGGGSKTPKDGTTVDTSLDTSRDTRRSDAREDASSDTDANPSDAPSRLKTCSSSSECPVEGTTCVQTVPFNRRDAEGVASRPVDELFESLADGEGVCSRPCSSEATACESVTWPGGRDGSVRARCQLVTRGVSPYEQPDASSFREEMEKGRPFGALCVPPIEASSEQPDALCTSCNIPSDCSGATTCIDLRAEAPREDTEGSATSICASSCDSNDECATGFECVSAGDSDYCLPIQRTCRDCRDLDDDGRGTGHCASDGGPTGVDCDDTNPEAYYDSDAMEHPWPGYCGSDDYNCDATPDREQIVGAERFGDEHCTACGDTCGGEGANGGDYACESEMSADSGATCTIDCVEGAAANCDGDVTNGCEVTVDGERRRARSERLFFVDADGDGFGDPSTAQVFCSRGAAEVANGDATLVTKGGDCDDDRDTVYPDAPEICDGRDNECDANRSAPRNVDEGCDEDDDGYCGTDQTVTSSALCKKGDCDDDSPQTHPGAASEDSKSKCMRDADGDGWGAADPPSGIAAGQDCEDGEPLIHPGRDELCNGVDDDCSGTIDDGTPTGVRTNRTAGSTCTPPDETGQCAKGYTWSCDAAQQSNGSGNAPLRPGRIEPLECTHPGTPPTPSLEASGFDGVDDSCDGVDRYASPESGKTMHAVWVSETTFATKTGRTPRTPLERLDEAIDKARNAPWCRGVNVDGTTVPCDIYVSKGTVPTTPTELENEIQIYGGLELQTWAQFSQANWPKRSGRTTLEVEPSASSQGRLNSPGFYGDALTERVRLDRLDVDMPDVSKGSNADNVAMSCLNCPGLTLARVALKAGEAGDGAYGAGGRDGPRGPNGRPVRGGGGVSGGSCIQNGTAMYRQRLRAFANSLQSANFPPFDTLGAGSDGDGAREGVPFIRARAGIYGVRDAESGGRLGSPGRGGERGTVTKGASGRPELEDARGQPGTPNDGGGGGSSEADTAGGSGGCPGLGGRPGERGGQSIGLRLVDSDGATLNEVRATSRAGGRGAEGGRGGDGGFGGFGGGSGADPGGSGAGGDGGGGGAGGHSIGCMLIDASTNGTFDADNDCNSKGAAGRGGDGGKGGQGEDGRLGRVPKAADGRDGGDGADGLDCDHYTASTFNNGRHQLRATCSPASNNP